MLTNNDLAEILREYSPESFILFYNAIQKEADPNTPIQFPAHLMPLVYGLCDTRINKLMLQVGPGAGKSLAVSQMFPAWLLGHDPRQTIMTISGAEDLAAGFLSSVMQTIEHSKIYKLAYPEVQPDKQRGWSMGFGAFVTGARYTQADASYNAFGLTSKALTGKHAGLIILDDLHDKMNSATKEQCQQVVDLYSSQIVGRAEATGARFILAGRRWSVHDVYGVLERSGGWVTLRLPAERPNSEYLWYDIYVPQDVECVFTDGCCHLPDGKVIDVLRGAKPPPKIPYERSQRPVNKMKWVFGKDPMKQGFFWPASAQKRKDYFEQKIINPTITRAVYQCDPASVETSVFLPEDFQMTYTPPEDLELGRANSSEVALFCEQGNMVVQSWDTAFSANTSSDYTVCVTALLVYNDKYRNGEDEELLGPCEPHYIVRVLEVRRFRANFTEVVREIRQQYMKWRANAVVIENKAYAVAAIETLKNSGIPLEPVVPEASKRARAIEGLGAGSAQGWFRQNRVEFPDNNPDWFQPLQDEMVDFTGEAGRTDDQVDAMVHLIRWVIMEGTGAVLPPGWDTPEAVNKTMRQNAEGSHVFGNNQINPFENTCSACVFFNNQASFCRRHSFTTVSLGSCDDHKLKSSADTIAAIVPDMALPTWNFRP